MATIFKASIETKSFTFEALGSNAYEAKKALRAGLKRHGQEYELPQGWHLMYIGDAIVAPMELGKSYRDGELIK